jgi:hypothetical protein
MSVLNGTQLTFEDAEALTKAVQCRRAGTPIIVRSEKDGRREVVWSPEDVD